MGGQTPEWHERRALLKLGQMQEKLLGNVLVVGGCGFLGRHLVKAFLDDPDTGSVHVLSRNPNSHRYPEAHYHAGDITSPDAVKECLAHIQPQVIVHAASPDPFEDPVNPGAYHKVHVKGTANLLACATETPSAVAFVYTSSATVVINNEQGECILAAEDVPIHKGPFQPGPFAYYQTKGIADELVRAANRPSGSPAPHRLYTGCIRTGGIYGEGDMNLTWMSTELAKKGLATIQLGDNKGLFDPAYVGNVTDAHVLLSKALVRRANGVLEQKVDGEAFNITDDNPVHFWDWNREIYALAGTHVRPDQVWIIPNWLLLLLGTIVEWFYWILYRGQRRPRHLQKQKLEFLILTRTYSVSKAKERLGWRPKYSTAQGLQRGVDWALQKWTEEKAGGSHGAGLGTGLRKSK